MLAGVGGRSLGLRTLGEVLKLLGEGRDSSLRRCRPREGMGRRTWFGLLVVTVVVVGSSSAGLDGHVSRWLSVL